MIIRSSSSLSFILFFWTFVCSAKLPLKVSLQVRQTFFSFFMMMMMMIKSISNQSTSNALCSSIVQSWSYLLIESCFVYSCEYNQNILSLSLSFCNLKLCNCLFSFSFLESQIKVKLKRIKCKVLIRIQIQTFIFLPSLSLFLVLILTLILANELVDSLMR